MQNCNSKLKIKIDLKKAVDFHGHLGPYLILGMLMGELALKKLKAKKHFGIEAIVRGASEKPKSCLIDGIQISAGCTYGKGNIKKMNGRQIQVLFCNLRNNAKMKISFKKDLIRRLDGIKGHVDSEKFARKLVGCNPLELFQILNYNF
ncbi:MAG: hypothetical protein FJZ13_02355 [Candidatus Omnitrophica bacterium]|nr:hypothetical protein [Candidatus Omnitrophota bacterium]